MLNKEDIIKLLNTEENFVDKFILDAFIKNWKIEAIYEDENGTEYYDDAALENIKRALGPKEPESQIYTVEESEPKIEQEPLPVEVVEEIKTEVIEPQIVVPQEMVKNEVQEYQSPQKEMVSKESELKNITLDITSQTLNTLAQTIAQKITGDISQYLKQNEWVEEAFDAGALKHDNEVLAKKLAELIEDNKLLISRINELEDENESFVNVFGNIYVKKSQ